MFLQLKMQEPHPALPSLKLRQAGLPSAWRSVYGCQTDAVFESRRDSTFIDNELNIITIPIGIALQECSTTLVSFIIFVIYYKCSTPPVSYVLPVRPPCLRLGARVRRLNRYH